MSPNWVDARLRDLIQLHDNRRVPLNSTERAIRRGSYPYYGANGLVDHIDGYLFDGNYVLLAEDGGYFDDQTRGVAYEVAGKFWVNNHAHILKPKGKLENRFLKHWLNAIDWMPYVGGSTRPKLTQGGIDKVVVPLPPLAEQSRIVSKIDSLSSKARRARDHLDRTPNLISHYKRAILSNTFSSMKGRAAAIERFISDAEIGLVRSKLDQSSVAGVPYIRMQHFDMNGLWNNEGLTYVNTSSAELKRYELCAGDVLFNTRNSFELVGKVAIWPHDKPGHVYNNNLLRMRFAKLVCPKFAAIQMMSPQFRGYLESVKSATTSVCAIYQRSLMVAPFVVPTLDVQIATVKKIETSFAWIDRLASEATSARKLIDHLDQAILSKAFRGELVPQDPNDEPASVLLERIKAEEAGPVPARRGRGRPRVASAV